MNEKETGKSPADIAGDIRVIETDISHIKGDISDLKDGLKSQGKDISDLRSDAAKLQQGQAEIKTMIEKILVALPEKVEKQGQKISWLFGLVAGLSLMVTIIAVILRN